MKWARTSKGLRSGPYEIEREEWSDSRRGKNGTSYIVLMNGAKIGTAPTLRYAKTIVDDNNARP